MQTNNKQIAKNAMALYFRMIAMMLISFFTARIVLNALGITDYGIYNVVGGFVAMFSIISGSVVDAVSRTLTFELGAGNTEKLKKTFSTSLIILLGLSLFLMIIFEVVGIWYLNNKMVIPDNRLYAANWCFQLSILTFLIGLMNAPYSASVISHERMDIYAYFSILDAIFKLLICYAVVNSPIDTLIMYAILLCLVSIVKQGVFWAFCKRNFEECKFKWIFDKELFKGLSGFAGWSFIGSSAAVLRTQGATLLLNWAGGPAVNAANGIANNICNIVNNFVYNFTQAFNPQITKRYASREYESLLHLLIYGAKFSYFLLFLLALPIMFNAHFILHIWLGIVPTHTVSFVRLIIVFMLVETVSRPFITAKSATGVIRNYQIVVGGIILMVLPMSYLGIKIGLPIEVVPICNLATASVAVIVRMYMLRGIFPNWSSRFIIKKVIVRVIIVSFVASIIPYISYKILDYGWMNFLTTSSLCIVCSCLSILYIGCDKIERIQIIAKVKLLYKNKLLKSVKKYG